MADNRLLLIIFTGVFVGIHQPGKIWSGADWFNALFVCLVRFVFSGLLAKPYQVSLFLLLHIKFSSNFGVCTTRISRYNEDIYMYRLMNFKQAKLKFFEV